MLLKNQLDWIKIVDITPFSIFESVELLLIQTLKWFDFCPGDSQLLLHCLQVVVTDEENIFTNENKNECEFIPRSRVCNSMSSICQALTNHLLSRPKID